MTTRQSLAFYKMERVADHVLCALDFLANGDASGARRGLAGVLRVKHFLISLRKMRRHARFWEGIMMFLTTLIGLGTVGGRTIASYFRYDQKQRIQPLNDEGKTISSWQNAH